MQSPISSSHLQISKLGLLSLKIDSITSTYNDLHTKLINDWRPKIVQQIRSSKHQIEHLIRQLDVLYQENILDGRASYIQVLVLKLKKSMNGQNQINVILENERENCGEREREGRRGKEKEGVSLVEQKQMKNRVVKTGEEIRTVKPAKKPTTPLKPPPSQKPSSKYSPYKPSKHPVKPKVILNNLNKDDSYYPPKPLRQYTRSRSPQQDSSSFPANYQSPLDKMGSARINKNPAKQKMTNSQKLQNLMLTIKMTKEEYYEYMKDN